MKYSIPLNLEKFIRQMLKVELHIHLEGSIRPETLLTLAERNNQTLPATSLDQIRDWYQFSDFNHFLKVYFTICDCIRTPQDFYFITSEFLQGQAEQNIVYSEVIFTPYTHIEHVPFDEQLTAINRARQEAETELGIQIALVPDISRHMRPVEDSFQIADWAAENVHNGIIALGLGGPEVGNQPEVFQPAFERIKGSGLLSLPHAGETEGPASIWGAINALSAARIGHGVRCLEDPELVSYLRDTQIPLDVCPTSNVCLDVVPAVADHPLPELIAEELLVTINSDDPSMFDTTLTDEYLRIVDAFNFDLSSIKQLVINGIKASLLPQERTLAMQEEFNSQFIELENDYRI